MIMRPLALCPVLTVANLRQAGFRLDRPHDRAGFSIEGIVFWLSIIPDKGFNVLVIETRYCKPYKQTISILRNRLKFGYRYYLNDPHIQGRVNCLYYVDGVFMSRNYYEEITWRPAFNTEDKRRARVIKLLARINGSANRGPARGQKRLEALAQLQRTGPVALLHYEVADLLDERDAREARRARAAVARSARQGPMAMTAAMLAGNVVPECEALLEDWDRLRAAGRVLTPTAETDADRDFLDRYPTLDLRAVLRRMQQEATTLRGWRLGWLDAPTRGATVTMICDRREPARLSLRILFEHRGRGERVVQELALARDRRDRWMMQCPVRNTNHEVLYLRSGRFACAEAQKLIYPSSRMTL